uniref:Rho guanine nucleotide exchange factor (GEF) 11 n=1 Tax=Oreochromis niloticus TaxID=8128 RepID=A0A669E535_ORENI
INTRHLPFTITPLHINIFLERKSSAPQQREPTAEIIPDITGTGLVHRCVIVQKDQLGFGFTVCGERVKLVQNVRPGGAAVKAGVQEGDRIIKVNGSLVSSMSHQEVVKLIKSGPYVALTLQGPSPSTHSLPLEPLQTDLTLNQRASLAGEAAPPPPPPLPSGLSSTPSQRITGPKPLQDPQVQKHATQILRKMLEQEEAELQDLMDEQLRNPSPSLEERIESAKRRAHQVRVKIQQDVVSPSRLPSFPPSPRPPPQAFESPHSSPSFSFRTPLHRRQWSDISTLSDSVRLMHIFTMDGPYQDIDLLKTRPAHMAVFMRYVFTQLLDPNPLLFYLSVEAYLGSLPKDARTLAPQICSLFLEPDAPLKIKVREEYLADIENRLHAQEDIRGPLSELQQLVLPEIQDQLQDYRNKQMMGLGSLFGEGDLQHLDGDTVKEKQVVDKQVTALWEILSKHEEDRSSTLASAVILYLRHSGIKPRDSKVFPGLTTEKDKWITFLKPKKLSGTKKEKDGEDKKRNPILKYIGKPRTTSQSTFWVCFVRSIPTSPLPVRLARSESLKAQGEGRRRGGTSGAESVPRSRSDVDMDDCADERDGPGLRPLQHSASSSASSNSARSLENPTPPYTPRSRRRSVESPLALLPDVVALEDDVMDSKTWQETVTPQLLATLSPSEVDRQAVIYELFTTEVSHLRTLRVLDQVFYQKMRTVLTSDELACIFPNLPQVYELHASLCEAMKKRRESPIVQDIGDVMLTRFEGAAGDEFQEQASQLCCQQSQALELIKSKQRKDARFAHIIQECEASPHCRRLQLKDLLVSEMQRLTKYPLLLDKIIKYTEAGSSDLPLLQRVHTCCRGILQSVNEDVRESEHRQRLSEYQRRLDAAPQFKNVDLTTKRMIHEGPLTWKVNKEKLIEIQALLLSDCLVLLQKGPDDRLQLRYHSSRLGVSGGGSGDSKTSFSPLMNLASLLVRPVATGMLAAFCFSSADVLKSFLQLCFLPDNSMTEQSDSTETHSNNDEPALCHSTPADQSEAFICGDRQGVAEAALQDVETLRQLILQDFGEDGWSHDSDDTPTNETATESISFTERQRPESLETVLSCCTDEWEAEPEELLLAKAPKPSFQVVRKGVDCYLGSFTKTLPVLLHLCDSGNTFYLVMPIEQGESMTEDLNEPPTPTASHFPPPVEEVTSPQTQMEEEPAARGLEANQSETMQLEQEKETGHLQAAQHTHVIRNVDEIFHTIEELMTKLRHLKVSFVGKTATKEQLAQARSFTAVSHHSDLSDTIRHYAGVVGLLVQDSACLMLAHCVWSCCH